MTSEAPQDVAALPQTEAGRIFALGSLADAIRRWGAGYTPLSVVLEIEQEAAAASPDVVLGLLDQNDRLREALEWALRNNGGECPADYPAGYAKALRVLWGSGAEEAARND